MSRGGGQARPLGRWSMGRPRNRCCPRSRRSGRAARAWMRWLSSSAGMFKSSPQTNGIVVRQGAGECAHGMIIGTAQGDFQRGRTGRRWAAEPPFD
jgi:hypothetical protein